MFQHVLQVDRY